MHFKNLTFNDLPTVVGELCKRIESLETVLKNSLAVQNKVKENHHVPMTVDEVCTYLGISKVSIRQTTGIKLLYTTIATVTMNLIVSAAIVLLNLYITVCISY